MNKSLARIYFTPARTESYSGANKLLVSVRKKYKPREVINWLESHDAYNRHKIVRRRFPRRHYNVRNIDDVWEADLMDMRSIKAYNDGWSYLLVVIDVLSKYAWIEPVTDKTSKNVSKAFERILSRANKRTPVYLQTDKGKEFIGKEMKEVLCKKDILYRIVRSPDTKAAIAERFIRTMKERIWRYFTHKSTHRYIDILQRLVESYNNTRHSGTKMQPASVTIYNAYIARKNLEQRYSKNDRNKTPKYSVGDLVRVSRAKNVFGKGYEGGWTLELFKISRISCTTKPLVYFLRDLEGEEIDGYFYEEELSRVRKNFKTGFFEVEQILKTSGNGPHKKYFVKWKDYPDKFNSWVQANQIKKLQ